MVMAFVVMLLMRMTTGTAAPMVVTAGTSAPMVVTAGTSAGMVVITGATALMIVFVVMAASATAAFVMVIVRWFLAMITGKNGDFGLHGSGNFGQPGQQTVGIICGDPELFGGEGDRGIFYFGKKIEFILDSGGAVGAVQLISIYEHTLMCLISVYAMTRRLSIGKGGCGYSFR